MGIDAVIFEILVQDEVKSFLVVSASLSRFRFSDGIPSDVLFIEFLH